MPNPNDEKIKEMLETARVIAVVGHSDRPNRTSYRIASYLRDAGYKVYAVNPLVEEIDGEISYASLDEIPEPVDIVNVFRRSIFLDGVIDDSITANAKAVWSQLGVIDYEAGEKAEDAGLDMVMNRCILVERERLLRN